MRLLLVTPDFPPALGGIQRVQSVLAEQLASEHDVTVLTAAQPDAAAFDGAAGYRVVRTRARWGGARSLAVLAELAAYARREQADAVVAGHLVVLPAAVSRLRPRPVVAWLYGSELWDRRAQAALRRYGQGVRRFVAISEFTAREAVAAGADASRVAVTSLGGDAPVEPPDARERLAALGLVDGQGVRPFLLTVARLAEPHKGQDVVLRSLPALAAREPRLAYVVAGDGPLRPTFERLAGSVGADGIALFAGRVDEPTKAALLTHCRALAMPSREARAAGQFEGFGIVYVEAALAGRPSIAARAGAAPELVVDGETGLLVDPDSPSSFTFAALRLLEDAALADTLGTAARARAEATLTWEAAGPRIAAATLEAIR